MIAGGTCAPITDYASYANRQVTIVAESTSDTYGSSAHVQHLQLLHLILYTLEIIITVKLLSD